MLAAIEEQIEAAAPVPACLWQENPYRLVSLWILLNRFEAHGLLNAVRRLKVAADLIIESKQDPVTFKANAIERFGLVLSEISSICESLGLVMSGLHATQLNQAVTGPGSMVLDSGGADRIYSMLAVTIENELSLREFFALSPEKAPFYRNAVSPFGNDVAAKFPSIAFDSAEASRCYALGRNTACVFHLMRVLEIGLTVMGRTFNISLAHTNWAPAIEQIESKVREMHKDPIWKILPDCKEQQEFYAQAASYFGVVKDAWRNYTAHVRGKYDDQEAADILTSVRAFMQKLATRLHE